MASTFPGLLSSPISRRRAAGLVGAGVTAAVLARAARAVPAQRLEKIALWGNEGGPRLRGAVLYQRRVYREIDGTDLGPGPVGPVYSSDDLQALSLLGSNVAVISHPGLFTEKPPFQLDRGVQANLDRLLNDVWRADMFAVIAVRTGPGRSEFTFFAKEAGSWFPPSKLNDTVWGDAPAQQGWVDMWGAIAERYRGHPAVVGYELMVEPNSSAVGKDAQHDNPQIWDPAVFERRFGGTLYDWNQLFPRIIKGIRAVDPHTPVLVGGNGYSGIDFLNSTALVDDRRTVYVVHSYEPRKYTHQEPGAGLTFPGRVDVDWNGTPDSFDKGYLSGLYAPVDAFKRRTGRDVAATEIGAMRWVPNVAGFMRAQTAVLEAEGVPYTVYQWAPISPPYSAPVTSFNIRLGDSATDLRHPVQTSDYLELLKERWSFNRLRPSGVRFPDTHE